MKKVFAFSTLALAAFAANAQFSIYGLIDGSVGKSIAADQAGEKADFHSGGDNGNGEGNSTTRVGLKGSYDVGSGLKANFRFESNGITSDGNVNSPTIGRQAWAGFSGSWGEVRLGRQDSVPFQVMGGYDLNGQSNGVSAAAYSTVATWAPGRQSRSLQYISPKIAGGFTAQAGFVPKGNVVGAKDTFSLGGTYATGPLSVSAAFESKRTQTGDKFASVAGSYDLGMFKVALGYADAGDFNKGVTLGVSTNVAGFTLGAQFGKNSKGNKEKAYELFVNKEVFKNTYAYLEAGSAKNLTAHAVTGKTKGTGAAAGLIFVF
jgi:predicted porin